MKSAARGQQLVRDGERVAIAAAAAEYERDELVVAKRCDSVREQLLARTIGQRQLFHRTTTVVYLKAMSRRGRCSLVGVVLTTTLLTGLTVACGDDPPTKELQQAQQAIDEARGAGAERYATDDFNAAQDALKRAQAAVAGRDYRQALNDALDARDRAQTASQETVDRKARAKADADKSLRDAALVIVDARAKLRAAETSHRPAKLTSALRRDVTDAETHVQEARTTFDKGDYLDVIELLNRPMQRLNDSVKAIDTAAPAGQRRRP